MALYIVLEMFGCDGVFYLGRGIGESMLQVIHFIVQLV